VDAGIESGIPHGVVFERFAICTSAISVSNPVPKCTVTDKRLLLE
jgi:hypothetical protein